ncbi:hypothetical protein [Effusibacillus lacus]|uniref:HEAT repeat domain-containing protein n=1 Tax=Effusibacillus lacus TaxID=1348429 RepID=A0A292YH67_9BACL|nr:hypothetical protein [Effusibacillus lacus]TCS71590.1 hypothetical protein EDD64_1252 [Effusibacillus lacus]GAX90097.1 hypothetical protein EFBL_1723 [Effusibacillus lacus]
MGKNAELTSSLRTYAVDPAKHGELETMFIEDSRLPGPRTNLQLASAFADCFEKLIMNDASWFLLQRWANIPAEEAPANDPREFLPFCAVQALAEYYGSANEKRREVIILAIRNAMNDSRWRMREAAAIGFQRMGEKDFGILKTLFSGWLKEANLLERRGIVAALAHPPLLKDKQNVAYCLEVTEQILNDLLAVDPIVRKMEEFRVLSKGLEFAISVFVASDPETGFALLRKYALKDDKDMKRIIRSNLGKARLTKKYGEQVEEVWEIL